MILKYHAACFTGHRPSKFPFNIKDTVSLKMFTSTLYFHAYIAACEQDITTFYCGMQTGTDVWAGKEVLNLKNDLKKTRPDLDIKLICVSPYEDEITLRRGADLDDYIYLKENCDEFIPLQKSYSKDCYRARNIYMVDRSDLVIAAVSDLKSGTGQTLRYAERLGKKVEMINLDRFKSSFMSDEPEGGPAFLIIDPNP